MLAKGPVAILYDEDGFALHSTIAHLLKLGFRAVLVVSPFSPDLPEDPKVHGVTHEFRVEGFQASLNQLIAAAPPKTWLHQAFNGEFLFYPFTETRSIGELCAFHAEERRHAFFTMVVDCYGSGSGLPEGDVDPDDVWFDGAGYYALPRLDAANRHAPIERQIDLHGGLRWRLEELVPVERRRADRIALFQAQPGLTMRPDHTLSDAELNTVSCPWHHNLTIALISFRAAKALRTNAATRDRAPDFRYGGSLQFNWSSEQLLEHGLIDPGQWF